MEIETATGILNGTIANRQNELRTLELALSILQGEFEPQLTELESKRAQIVEAESVIRSKDEQISLLQAENVSKTERIAELEAKETA